MVRESVTVAISKDYHPNSVDFVSLFLKETAQDLEDWNFVLSNGGPALEWKITPGGFCVTNQSYSSGWAMCYLNVAYGSGFKLERMDDVGSHLQYVLSREREGIDFEVQSTKGLQICYKSV